MTGTLTQEERGQMATYKQPTASVGMTVLWYPDAKRSREPSPAIVTKVAMRTIDVSVLPWGVGAVKIKDGVCHIDDPKAKESQIRESGCWDYTDDTKSRS